MPGDLWLAWVASIRCQRVELDLNGQRIADIERFKKNGLRQ
jgi:hypothetical protein